MRALYEARAKLIAIHLRDEPVHGGRDVDVHERAVVTVADGKPVSFEVVSAQLGVEEPIAAAAARFGLDAEALLTAARAALSAPDREIVLEVGARTAV